MSYQWQKDNVNLSDGGHYSGSRMATLTITERMPTTRELPMWGDQHLWGHHPQRNADRQLNECVSVSCWSTVTWKTRTVIRLPDWTSYSAGNGTASWAKEGAIIHGGSASQKCRNSNGERQPAEAYGRKFGCNIGGRASRLKVGFSRCQSGAGQQVAMVVRWEEHGESTTGSGSRKISTGLKNVWTHLQHLSGNATATNVTLFWTAGARPAAGLDRVLGRRGQLPRLRAMARPRYSSAAAASLNVEVKPAVAT